MKISELLEEKVEMCPKECCGKPVTECKCGPDCPHCDCYEKNKKMNEEAQSFKKGAEDANKLAKQAVKIHSKADAAMANSPVSKTTQYKNYKKTSQQKKIAAMKKGMPYGRQDVGETATAGATSAGAVATVANPITAHSKNKKRGKYGAPQAPQKKNPDGTAKNALDVDNNLMGGKTIKR